MSFGRSTGVGWSAGGLAVGAWALALALVYSGPPSAPQIPLDGLVWATPYIFLAIVGGLIVVRRPANRVGWLLLAITLLQGSGLLGLAVLRYVYAGLPNLPALAWLTLVIATLSTVTATLPAFVVLTFPDGRLPSRRWRWLALVLLVDLALNVADVAVSSDPPLPGGLPVSPLANPAWARPLDLLASGQVSGLLLLASAGALVVRYRRGNAVLRQQLKWFGLGVAILAVGLTLNGIGSAVAGPQPRTSILSVAGTVTYALAILAVPLMIAIAILRHRLFDIDLIISRTLAYGTLAAMSTVLYVGIVLGVGGLIGRGAAPNLALSIVATALVALVFQPLRLWLQTIANRLVYGRRQAPYDALRDLTRQLGETYAVDELLLRMVKVIAVSLGVRSVALTVETPASHQVVAQWPAGALSPSDNPAEIFDLRHQGKLYGRLSVWTAPGDDLPLDSKAALGDLAMQAGVLLHNARLSAELQERLEELRASRLRLVTAQDQERRRLERDLHDGAQHELVALRMKLGLAEGVARASSAELATLLAELREDTAATLENIRRLSRGLYPPLLESQGLASALAAHARRLPLAVRVQVPDGRFGREVETAIYFCCVEALQNVVKHSSATRAWISIDALDAHLRFEVGDNGHGFDPSAPFEGSGLQNLRDRIDSLEGTVDVISGIGGTRLLGIVPLGTRSNPESAEQPAIAPAH